MDTGIIRLKNSLTRSNWTVYGENEHSAWLEHEDFQLLLVGDRWLLYEKSPFGLVFMDQGITDRRQSQIIKRLVEKRQNWRQRQCLSINSNSSEGARS